MQNNTTSNTINTSSSHYPTIGYMEERRIKGQIDTIAANSICRVTDISPNAHCVEYEYSGKYLKEHFSEILWVLKHWFIVKNHWANGEDTIIFVYMGPIPRVVENILNRVH